MKKTIILLGIVALMAAVPAIDPAQSDPWKVPDNYAKLKNPVAADKASVQSGKEVYKTYCTSCHGIDGTGSGKRSRNLKTAPADFTTGSFQAQTDGALLYKVYFGHKQMPGFQKRLPGHVGEKADNFGKTRIPGDLVNFLRSFAKK